MMQLLFAPPSPFARKVRVLIRELGLQDHIAETAVHTTPTAPAQEVAQVHPLAKIPTLLTEDGQALYDSRVVCSWLLHRAAHHGIALPPRQAASADTQAADHWAIQRRQALADGMLDAGLAHRYETVLRPADLHWRPWLDAQRGKITSGLAALAEDLPPLEEGPGLDAIAIACALGWLALRMPELRWRTEHPALAVFFDAMAARASMAQTQP